MRSRRTLVICTLAGIVVVIASAVGGAVRLTGPRWVPDWNPTPEPMSPPPGLSLPQATQATQVAQDEGGGTLDLGRILLWVAIGIAVVVAAVLLWRWLARRPSRTTAGPREVDVLTAAAPEAAPEPEPDPDPPVVRRGVDEALRLLDEEREPADAVMKAWLGLQQTAEDSGIVRMAAETPTEFTSRIMRRVFADDRAITTLLTLYLRTRFGDHPVTAAEVARARVALQGLARSWDATAGSTAPDRRQ